MILRSSSSSSSSLHRLRRFAGSARSKSEQHRIFCRQSYYSDHSNKARSLSSSCSQVNHNNNNSPSSSQQQQHDHDRLLVIGSGVAGSAAALIAAETYQIPVTMLFAGNVMTDCNSFWAQGGIIYRAPQESGDSAELLAADIHRAGAGLCQDNAVVKVATEGPERVRQLLLDSSQQGVFANVPFDRNHLTGQLSFCLEASHAAPRILHKADHTGRTITECITQAVARHPLITQQPHTVVTDLIVDRHQDNNNNNNNNAVCVGVETLDRTTGQTRSEYATRGTLLASGGFAGIYQHSTNPPGFNALGSSVALAARAKVATQDLEYVQFHPTSLYIPNEARFLLTEALRGEGAILRNAQGRAFCRDYHEAAELAPRDVVARAVFEETRKTNECVYLDITHRNGDWLHDRFPSIQAHLQQRGLDLAKDLLPVIPAAHYTCGGVATDLSGKTSLNGLYAAGEAARTGLHGGNRLASTSLLEALVFGASVADHVGSTTDGKILRDQAESALAGLLDLQSSSSSSSSGGQQQQQHQHALNDATTSSSIEPIHIENAAHRAMQLLGALRRTMWDFVGVVRTPSGLLTALDELEDIREEATFLHATCPTLETAAVRDAAFAGQAVTEAALANRTSIGAHCVVPDNDDTENILEDSDEDEHQLAAAR